MDLRRPHQLWLPKERVNKHVKVDHEYNLKQLAIYKNSFAAQSKFWIDVAVLDRLYYKNYNQHRHFHRFRRTAEARRLLKRFKHLAVDLVIRDFYTMFWNNNVTDSKKPWTSVPTREFCEYTMRKLIAASVVLDKLQVVLVEIYREYTTLLHLQHFVSMAFVHIGVCARLYTLARKWNSDFKDCYTMIHDWLDSFPLGSNKASGNVCTENTMTQERQNALQWTENRISFAKPAHFEFHLVHGHDEQRPLDNARDQLSNLAIPFDSFSAMPVGDDEDDLGIAV
ncbi:hypothetical protein BC940DRAFT_313457 [Gongronella butleri]|nr:hypothetical protein BC940DRAFT_313457 [Gongronella butleri]